MSGAVLLFYLLDGLCRGAGLHDNAVAFELHKKASHYLEFNDAISGMVNKKSIRLLKKINH